MIEKITYKNCCLQKLCSGKNPESGKNIKKVRNSEIMNFCFILQNFLNTPTEISKFLLEHK